MPDYDMTPYYGIQGQEQEAYPYAVSQYDYRYPVYDYGGYQGYYGDPGYFGYQGYGVREDDGYQGYSDESRPIGFGFHHGFHPGFHPGFHHGFPFFFFPFFFFPFHRY